MVRNSSMSGSAGSVNRVNGTMKISTSHVSTPAINVLAGSCINVIDDSDNSINTDCT